MLSPAFLRSSQGLKTNQKAALFEAAAPSIIEYPEMAILFSRPSTFSRRLVIVSTTALVLVRDAASGSCTFIMAYPKSSFGTNPFGRESYLQNTPNVRIIKASIIIAPRLTTEVRILA